MSIYLQYIKQQRYISMITYFAPQHMMYMLTIC